MGATIHNSDLKKSIIDNAKIQLAIDKVPSELAEKVVPTLETNPNLLKTCEIIRHATKTITGSQIIYTCDTSRQFYLTGIHLAMTTDAANDGTGVQITFNTEGGGARYFHLLKTTLVASTQAVSMNFSRPIKIDKGTNLILNTAFTVGTGTMAGTILGYYLED